MLELLFVLMALLLLTFGLLLITAKDFQEPTIWRFYFPPFYEKIERPGKLLVRRKLKNSVRIALAWYFIAAGLVISGLLLFIRLVSFSSC